MALAYRRQFHPDRDWELDEHRITGIPVLPGASVVALVVTAIRSLSLLPADVPVELRDTVFITPVIGTSPRQLRVRFLPAPTGYRFRVSSQESHGAARTHHHAIGIATASTTACLDTVDLHAVRKRLAPVPRWLVPVRGRRAYGPRWHSTIEVQQTGSEYLAELTLPPPFHPELAEYPLHPVLLDRAVPTGTEQVYLPFLYRRISVFEPLPERVVAHGRSGQASPDILLADVDLRSPGGRLLVAVRGYRQRAVGADRLAGWLSVPETHPGATTVPAAPSARAAPDDPIARPVPGRAAPAPPGAPDDLATTLCGLWTEVLAADQVGLDDDFFDLGGDSLRAVQLSTQIRQRLGLEVSTADLFRAGSIRRLILALRPERAV